MSVKVVGHVNTDKEKAYILEGGQAVTFHSARSPKGEWSVFYTPLNMWPSITAHKLGIKYSLLRNSTPEEVRTAVKAQGLNVIGATDV